VFNTFGAGDPKVDQAAQMSGTLQKKINTVLQNRPGRVAEQYRLELENIIRLEPEILRSDTAYTHRLAHTDLELRTHLKSLRKIADGEAENYSKKEREDAMRLVNTIQPILMQLGVPRPASAEEMRLLKPGTSFIAPDGSVRLVPERRDVQ
jgi:hypothetical protein